MLETVNSDESSCIEGRQTHLVEGVTSRATWEIRLGKYTLLCASYYSLNGHPLAPAMPSSCAIVQPKN